MYFKQQSTVFIKFMDFAYIHKLINLLEPSSTCLSHVLDTYNIELCQVSFNS